MASMKFANEFMSIVRQDIIAFLLRVLWQMRFG